MNRIKAKLVEYKRTRPGEVPENVYAGFVDDELRTENDEATKELLKRIKKYCINDMSVYIKIVDVYLTDIENKFTDITGTYIFKNTQLPKFNSYEAYKTYMFDYNKNKDIFQLALIFTYWKRGVDVPIELKREYVQDLNKLKQFVREKPQYNNPNIINVMFCTESPDCTVLLYQMLQMICIMPTSSTVESIFSHMKNIVEDNMYQVTIYSKLLTVLQTRTEDFNVYNAADL